MTQKQNPAANALMEQILNGNKQGQQGEQAIQMPQLALRCAQFFHSLSQYCLYFYKNYNREADIHKTKLIKKVDKSKKNRHDQLKKSHADEKKARAQRGQQEPQPPKKPLTAYILYFQDKKPSFAQKFPTLSLSELTKLIAKDWKDLKQDQKKPYLDKATDDRKRYETQMNEFKRKHRLGGQQNKQEQEVIVEENKASQILQQKEEQIPIEIEQAIQAAQLQNEGEQLGNKSEREDAEQNLDQGVNEDGQDDQDEEDGEQDDNNDESQNNDGQEQDQIQNEGSEQAKIDEQ